MSSVRKVKYTLHRFKYTLHRFKYTLHRFTVKDVQRKEGKAVHTTDKPVPVGSTVEVVVDWKRRYDHMQQHTGMLGSLLSWAHCCLGHTAVLDTLLKFYV